jgi:hypothetical protein
MPFLCLDTLRKRAWPKLVGLFGLYHERSSSSGERKRRLARTSSTTVPPPSRASASASTANEYSGSLVEIDASLLTGGDPQASFDSE